MTFEDQLDITEQAWSIAQQISQLRQAAGLTQAQLAKKVATSQSNIARIEDANYASYTLKTLNKIAKALNAQLEVSFK